MTESVQVAKKTDRVRIPDVLDALARRMEPDLRRAFYAAVEELKDVVNLRELADAIARAEDFTEWLDEVPRVFKPAADVIEATVMDALDASETQVRRLGVQINWNLLNDDALRYAQQRSGTLIQDIRRETLATIRRLIAEGFTEGRHPYETAQYVRDVIGLNDRLGRAVERYRANLLRQGKDQRVVQRMASAYADRLVKYRAETIARTETLWASNRGQELVWERAVSDGQLPAAQTMREWIAFPGERTCWVCLEMDGKQAPVGGQWQLPTGRMVSTPTQSHPNCRCTSGLIFSYERRGKLEREALAYTQKERKRRGVRKGQPVDARLRAWAERQLQIE